jgi:hypothetical protein
VGLKTKLAMGIFENRDELFTPGPTGTIDFDDKEHEVRQKYIPVRFAIALIIIGTIEYFLVFESGKTNDYYYILLVNIFLIVYLLLAAIIRVKPNTENLGWVPFLIGHPFRFSDNINRFLVVLNLLFLPGKYVSQSILGFYRYCKM